MTPLRRLVSALRVEAPEDPRALFEFRRVWIVPAWLQVVLVVGGFVATVFLTHAEYRAKGTTFGFAGPAFNVLVNPIYEELIFRGWILGRVARHRSAAAGIAVSSLLFGILHLRNIFWLDTETLVRSMIFTGAVLGPILAWVTLRCRSVWPAVILHYANNLTYFL
ncbi:MAG TPA: CPBP family intramembrane glutamic endopeptidase [Planctomycetota bacterium]|jgi:membrane protease YdiL (CAAX protease family)|nr:CPBP family intramembrane glutamic endopeptidase [Planctomycetota bacterium]